MEALGTQSLVSWLVVHDSWQVMCSDNGYTQKLVVVLLMVMLWLEGCVLFVYLKHGYVFVHMFAFYLLF